ncbi:MAG: hypothetical protein PHS96_01970 [Anaerolineales bacterium]|nr:hypothetical protein [Anaerolineales bacterium]
MKKHIWLIIIVLLVVALYGCSTAPGEQAATPAEATQTAPAAAVQTSGAGAANPGGGDRQVSQAMKLALGTFALEKSETPIDASQAKTLLTLWKAARSLNESETTAAQELEAVVKQIQAALTPEQVEAIEDMDLGFDDMQALAQEYGLELGGGNPMGEMTEEMQATVEAMRASGGGQQGGFMGEPGGGMPMGGMPGGEISPEMRETAQAARGSGMSTSGLGLPPGLLDAMIEFLQAKAK